MKHYTYNTSGTCARQLSFDLDGRTVHNVSFSGGCNGNLKAISKLVEGMDARELVEKLSGNTCGFKNTSCADQLARAIKAAEAEQSL